MVVKTFIGFSGIDKIYGRAARAHCILLGIWWEPSLAFTAKLCLGTAQDQYWTQLWLGIAPVLTLRTESIFRSSETNVYGRDGR